MVSATSAAAIAALCTGITAVELFSALDQSGTTGTTGSTTSPQAPSSLDSATQVLVPLAATVTLFTAVAFIYRHLHHADAVPVGAAANWGLTELVTLILCVAASTLQFFLSVRPAGGADGGGAQACALSMAVVGALPPAATVTFFLGMALVFAAHVRVGGEGGGGAVAAGDGSAQAPVWLLTKMALGAAAALVGLMAMALYTK